MSAYLSVPVPTRVAFALFPALFMIGCASASVVDPVVEPESAEVGAISDSALSGEDAGSSAGGNSESTDDSGAAPDPALPDPSAPDEPPAATDVASMFRLTEPGCCTGFFWGRNSSRILFIDRPSENQPLGIYSVDMGTPGEEPTLVTEEIGYYSNDLEYRFDLGPDDTSIIRVSDGERWSVPAGGRTVSISPDGTRIVWQVSPDVVPERRTTTAWIANLDGSDARTFATLPRGSFSGWLNDDAVLIRGREALQSDEDILWQFDVASGERIEITRAKQLRGEVPSPGGDWVVYYISREEDPNSNGTWIVPGTGGEPRMLDSSLFGAYRWRDANRLIVVPLSAGESAHALLEVDVRTLETRPLTDPDELPFKIANGEWSVSPDGQRVAILESADKAIHVIKLPPVLD